MINPLLVRLYSELVDGAVHRGGYGLSLMNEWARKGGNPFADARWDETWKISMVPSRATDLQEHTATGRLDPHVTPHCL